MRLLVIGTYRDTELADPDPVLALVGDLRRHHAVARVRLEGLDDGGVEAFLRAATGIDLDDQGRALSGAMRAETGGNPFFLGRSCGTFENPVVSSTAMAAGWARVA